jgi:hypothetical protein
VRSVYAEHLMAYRERHVPGLYQIGEV